MKKTVTPMTGTFDETQRIFETIHPPYGETLRASREKLRSAESCILALEGLRMALSMRIERTAELEREFAELDDRYRAAKKKSSSRAEAAREKEVPLKIKNSTKAREQLAQYREVRGALSEEIEHVLFFRSLLSQQVKDTMEFGHTAVADVYDKELASLLTPLETVALSEDTVTEKNARIVELWNAIREHVQEMLQQGQEVLIAMQRKVYRPNPKIRLGTT